MARQNRSQVERYHDRVAGLYDTIYDNDLYWEIVFSLTWRNILRYLPKNQAARCLDVGAGTGRWGMRLVKAGYKTDFLDISQKMMDQVATKLSALDRPFSMIDTMREDAVQEKIMPDWSGSILWHATIDDLSAIPSASYDFLVGQGDPLNCAARPMRALKEMTRILRPGGVMVMSVDNRLQGIYHYFRDGDVDGLGEFLRTGKTRWVTDNPDEQYMMTMFTPGQIRKMCSERGLEFLGMMGKTVLPLRRFRDLLEDQTKRETLMKMEESLNQEESMFANAAHLEFAARKPE